MDNIGQFVLFYPEPYPRMARARQLREFAQLVASAEVDAKLLGAVVLYMLPLVWLMRRWRRGGLLAALAGVVRLFVLSLMLMFAVVALPVRLEGRTYRSYEKACQGGQRGGLGGSGLSVLPILLFAL